jgi:inorganic phosphate transporter, PiT family
MADTALQAPPIEPAAHSSGPNLDKGFNPLSLIIFAGIMAAGLLYVVYSVYSDIDERRAQRLRLSCRSRCCSSPC